MDLLKDFLRVPVLPQARIGHAGPESLVGDRTYAHFLEVAMLSGSLLPGASGLLRPAFLGIRNTNPEEDIAPIGKQMFCFTEIFRGREHGLEEAPRLVRILADESSLPQEQVGPHELLQHQTLSALPGLEHV